MWKSQRRWGFVAKLKGKTGAPIKAQAMMYKALVQAVLRYGSEIWLMVDLMMTVLEGLHHKVTRRIAGMTAIKGDDGEWWWSSVYITLEVIEIW